MPLPIHKREIIFYVAALCIATAGIYHLIGIFYKVNDSPIWRHALFVCIDLFCIYGILKRPKYFIYIFFLLVIQQYYSHGNSLINQWVQYGKIDWISIAVLIVLPVIFACLISDHQYKKKHPGPEPQD